MRPGHRHESAGRKIQYRRGRRGRRPLHPRHHGDLRRKCRQEVASARFGVTSEYLVNSDDTQIKIAQGAKPGEGGQLAGYRVPVDRPHPALHARGGTHLPHRRTTTSLLHRGHRQLIHDLKSANPKARIHVKLVAEVGRGHGAAGVAKPSPTWSHLRPGRGTERLRYLAQARRYPVGNLGLAETSRRWWPTVCGTAGRGPGRRTVENGA